MEEGEQRTPGEIITSFNNSVNEAIRMLDRRLVDEAGRALIERLRKRLSLVRNVAANGREMVMKSAGPFLIKYSDQILERDESFFLAINIKQEHGHMIKPEEEFVYDLVDQIKALYRKAKQQEKDMLYQLVLSMLTDYLGYSMVAGGGGHQQMV